MIDAKEAREKTESLQLGLEKLDFLIQNAAEKGYDKIIINKGEFPIIRIYDFKTKKFLEIDYILRKKGYTVTFNYKDKSITISW